MDREEKEKTEINMVLSGHLAKQLSQVKKLLGFKTNSATLVHLINSAYERNSKES